MLAEQGRENLEPPGDPQKNLKEGFYSKGFGGILGAPW